MKPEPTFRKWLLVVVLVGYAAGLATALVGTKVPSAVLTLCVALPIVAFALRASLWKATKKR